MLFRKLDVIDKKVYDSLKFNEGKTIFFKSVTQLASTKYFFAVCILLLLFLNNKKLALIYSIHMIISAGLIGLFKNMIKRDRPTKNRLVKEKGYSYPSGHTFSGVCFYGFLVFIIWNLGMPLYLQIFITFALIILMIIIGISRIYLGVHYFTDVIGAFFISSCYLCFYVYFVSDVLKLLYL